MMIRLLRFTLLLALMSVLVACNLDAANDNTRATPSPTTPANAGKPSVTILSPQDGEEFVVNTPILMSVQVTDTIGVTSVRLSANNVNVRTVGSESPTGETSKQVLLDYTPRSAGEVVLSVTAVRGVGNSSVVSDPAELRVIIRQTSVQITATPAPQTGPNNPVINPNDPTCRALVMTSLRLRRGPNTNFDVIRTLSAGELLVVVARLNDNSWWQLRDNNGTTGWVARGPENTPYINLYDGTQQRCANIPGQAAPATPTPLATPTVAPTFTSVVPTNTPAPTSTLSPGDLVVSNITGPVAVTIPAGETSVTVQYGVNITNNGNAINTQFSNTLFILPTNTQQDLGVVGNLGAGQTISLTVNVTFSSANTYILQFQADTGNTIAEGNEVNNTGTINVTVTNAP
ncbi:MAG: SH3 domain-containing protein, partial [Phototrophicales bacterium]|nr:SH3 domain-containing protein [Phototrophicales bacterium]